MFISNFLILSLSPSSPPADSLLLHHQLFFSAAFSSSLPSPLHLHRLLFFCAVSSSSSPLPPLLFHRLLMQPHPPPYSPLCLFYFLYVPRLIRMVFFFRMLFVLFFILFVAFYLFFLKIPPSVFPCFHGLIRSSQIYTSTLSMKSSIRSATSFIFCMSDP